MTANEATATDARRQQLEQWLLRTVGIDSPGQPASSDASFRRYFRYQLDGATVVAMDAPPATEDCRPFIKIAGLMQRAGVTAPVVLDSDPEQGFLLLSDLGPSTLLQYLSAHKPSEQEIDSLFTRAIDALVKWQAISAPGELPEYDAALLRRELDLFPEWYLRRHLGLQITDGISGVLETLFTQLIAQVLEQARVFVHRDYMPRNLMVMADDIGVLDFQDAVYGPISYDPICLFKDAFISWPETRVERWLQEYWQRARIQSLPVPAQFADFLRDCDYMGVQRHLKVIGIFARICHRDGKPQYLGDVPRFFTYLHTVAQRRPELTALRELLVWLQQQAPGVCG